MMEDLGDFKSPSFVELSGQRFNCLSKPTQKPRDQEESSCASTEVNKTCT